MRLFKWILTCLLSWVIATTGIADTAQRVGMVLWDGCEDVCKGVMHHLAAEAPEIIFVPFDANRNVEQLAAMPDRVQKANLDLLLTWGTRVTRQMVGTKSEFGAGSRMGQLPVVFTVVSDPVASDIIESYQTTGRTHVTGTRNRVPEVVNINGLRQMKPGFSHLGLLYEPEAINSAQKFTELLALSAREEFQLTAHPLQGSEVEKLVQMGEAIAAMQAAKVDFVYLGSSTFLEAHAEAFTQLAVDHGLPVLSPYENLVHENQAYLSIAARDYDVGRLAADQALRVLVSEAAAGSFPVLAMQEFAFVLNGEVAKKLNLFPPLDVMQFVEISSEGRP